MALKKHLSFTGLTVELFEDVEEVQSYSLKYTMLFWVKKHAYPCKAHSKTHCTSCC